jgi:serine/threonine protein kinase
LFVEYFGWYENDDYVFIIMEYIQHGDLGSCLKVPLPENETREVTFQVAEGLEELHNNGFVHRDLKPEVKKCWSYVRLKEKCSANKTRMYL